MAFHDCNLSCCLTLPLCRFLLLLPPPARLRSADFSSVLYSSLEIPHFSKSCSLTAELKCLSDVCRWFCWGQRTNGLCCRGENKLLRGKMPFTHQSVNASLDEQSLFLAIKSTREFKCLWSMSRALKSFLHIAEHQHKKEEPLWFVPQVWFFFNLSIWLYSLNRSGCFNFKIGQRLWMRLCCCAHRYWYPRSSSTQYGISPKWKKDLKQMINNN